MKRPSNKTASIGRPWYFGKTGPIYYSWHGENNELYLTETPTRAQPDPLDIGKWILPSNATYVPPQPAQPGITQVWNGSGWDSLADFRYVAVWDELGHPATIDKIGVRPADVQLTATPPPRDYPARWDEKTQAWAPDIGEASNFILARLAMGAASEVDSLYASYPDYERDTWVQQRDEAARVIAANGQPPFPPTPLLSAIVGAGDINALAQKVLDKAAALDVALGTIIAKRKAKEATLKQAVDASDIVAILAITWGTE